MNKKIVKRIVKVLQVTLAATMILFAVGCSEQEAAFPEYEDDREMMIGAWDSPMNTLEDIQLAKDMGLTHMFLDSVYAKRGTEAYEEALKLYEQVGLDVIVKWAVLGKRKQP